VASLNTAARELVLKIVYYGPGLGGKTTSLQALHDSAPPERRGKLVSLATPVDRTLYFDFLPLRLPPLRGLSVRLQLFTVPGQVYFNATRRLVLSGADGIVFVADSQTERLDANLESLENLRENLAEHGRDLAQLPHVFTWNKRDLDEVVPIDELDKLLNRHGAAAYGTVAIKGTGVDQALEKITELVTKAYESQIPSSSSPMMQAPGLISLSPARMTLRGANGEEEIITSASDPPPLSQREVQEVVTSSTLLKPSEGTFLADVDRLEKSSRRDPTDEKESVADEDWDSESGPTSEVETRRATASDMPKPSVTRRSSAVPPPAVAQIVMRPAAAPSDESAVARAEEEEAPSQLSFAPLFAPMERALIEQIEASIVHGAYADAVGMCEAALHRLLTAIASLVGAGMPGGPVPAASDASLPLLVGLDGRRFLTFRAMARRARQIGDVGVRDVLECYAFLLEAKLAVAQWDALRNAMGASSAAPPPPRPSGPPPAPIPPLPRGSVPPPPIPPSNPPPAAVSSPTSKNGDVAKA
jgi:signal recognition particle receptor subunit beta